MSLALSPDALSIAVASASRLSVHGASAGSRERQYVQQGQLARRYACCAWSKDAALVAADGAELYACYALPGGAFARHVARWAVAGGEPAAWDGDKRGVSALAAHQRRAVAVGSTRAPAADDGHGRQAGPGGDARDGGAAPRVDGEREAKDGVWSLRLAAPGLEVCARAAPRAEGEEAVEVAVCLGDGRLQVASTASPDAAPLLDGRRDALAVAFVGDDLRAARGAASAPSAAAVDVARDAGVCAAVDGGAAPAAQRASAGRRGAQAASGARLRGARRRSRLRPDGEDGAARKRAKAAAADDDAALGDRLAALEALATREARRRRRTSPRTRHAAAADDGSGASLAAVLDQAVRCGDDALLETVLRRTEPATLADTLARLQYVVDARVAALPKFLSLLGKFDLLLHKKTGAAVSGAASAEVTPLNVVAADATDDEDEEEEDDDMEEEDDDDDESEEEEDDDDDDDSSDDDDE
ncbi:hypothetical protein JL720_2220 [Aureococcus anophagefferens]|nr:hypothetical protein JL720_2220 [Aureococcus anophagefferens]